MPLAIRGKILTDKRIEYYIRKGYYGSRRQKELETPKPKTKPREAKPLSRALKLLGL